MLCHLGAEPESGVGQVMELVELEVLSNAIVGKPGLSGLSVEQRKRLTIAVELVANPSIVFMDEPTSGAHPPTHIICVTRYSVAGHLKSVCDLIW